MDVHYRSEDEIQAVVTGFESCRTAKTDFPHYRHLTVAVSYLTRLPFDDAAERMRTGLFRFLDHHGVGREKYHETLTMFWMRIIRKTLDELSTELSLVEATNTIVHALADSRLVFDYYSRELLDSQQARKEWVAPDLLGKFTHE